MKHPARRAALWLVEALVFLLLAALLLVIALQRDAPTKFIYYNF